MPYPFRDIPLWLLFAGACIGHAYLLTIALNVFYGRPWPRAITKRTRKLDMIFILAGPFLFGYALDLFAAAGPDWLKIYACFSFVMAIIVAPVMQMLYWLRRTAPQLVAQTSTIVDVEKELGEPPVGNGVHARLALFPGNQVFQVEFRTLTLQMPNIPAAWDGLTILHLTDLHFGGTPSREFYDFVIERCALEGIPDIVAITGDIVDSPRHHDWVVPVLRKLPWNIAGFAILGNHDVWYEPERTRRELHRLGFQVVGNCWQSITVRDQRMTVIGNEDPWFTPGPELSAYPAGDDFRLLLSHTPDRIGWARRNKIDLMLAGHVHGGQLRVPLIGSIFVPSAYSRRYDCGTFYEAPTLMHVSRGLGGEHPLRYNCRPEVTRIVLRRGVG